MVVKKVRNMKLTFFMVLVLGMMLTAGCSDPSEDAASRSCQPKQVSSPEGKIDTAERLRQLQRQHDEIGTVACCERYIKKVINEGSDVLNLPAGRMAAGYASEADAEKIAAYIITFSGRAPTHPEYVKEGNLYYDGNCGGCHGEDGKGLGGTYPDLTTTRFAGMALKKKALKREIDRLKAE